MILVLSLVLAAPPQFEVTAPTPEERERRANIRCGAAARQLELKGDVGTFSCAQAGVDVTDALRQSELVVRGKITNVETPPARQFGDPAPQWRRATVKLASVLRGELKEPKEKTVKFLFIGSAKDGYELYPKVKVGQEGIWILTRGTGATAELMMTNSLAVSSEDVLKELITATACPEKLEGTCEHQGAVCPRGGVTCRCGLPCPGGAPPRPGYDAPQARWFCNPAACASAKEGDTCTPGLECEGCWGTKPWTCEKGRWKHHRIPPPP